MSYKSAVELVDRRAGSNFHGPVCATLILQTAFFFLAETF